MSKQKTITCEYLHIVHKYKRHINSTATFVLSRFVFVCNNKVWNNFFFHVMSSMAAHQTNHWWSTEKVEFKQWTRRGIETKKKKPKSLHYLITIHNHTANGGCEWCLFLVLFPHGLVASSTLRLICLSGAQTWLITIQRQPKTITGSLSFYKRQQPLETCFVSLRIRNTPLFLE